MKYIHYLAKDGTAVITIDRPPINATSPDLLSELDQAIQKLEGDEKVSVLVITGAGEKAFIGGADIEQFLDISASQATKLALDVQSVFNRLENMEKITIAAINGYALGGGLELALACDLRVASERAKIGQIEVTLGIIPGAGGTQRLCRMVPLGMAKKMILTGEMITAKEALNIGLVEIVVTHEQLMERTYQLAVQIQANGPLAVRKAKKVIREGLELPFSEALMLEARYFGELFDTHDQKEGARAFIEKRKPKYQGN